MHTGYTWCFPKELQWIKVTDEKRENQWKDLELLKRSFGHTQFMPLYYKIQMKSYERQL